VTTNAEELDPQRQARARQYADIRRRWMLAELGLGVAYLAVWLITGWSVAARNAIGLAFAAWLPSGAPWWLVLVGEAAALALPWMALTLPISYYTGFRLPHRYDLSTQNLRGWIDDGLKGLALGAALGVPLLVGMFALIRWMPSTWWLWATGLYTLVTAVLATLAPLVFLPLFYHQTPLGDERADLRQRLVDLADRAGARVEGVFKIDMSRRTRTANAALTGMGRTRRILLGDTLLDSFSSDEIETVLAHELGHHVHKDIPLSLAVDTLLNLLGFLIIDAGLTLGVAWFGLASPFDPAALPWIALLLGAFGLITMPLSNAFSRWRESMADDFSLQVTGKPAAFASAMTRLANQNLAEAEPAPWVVFLLYSHPPLQARINKARVRSQALSHGQ
jgi:STE24 endopeptidase